jgi:hypothetical protein
MEMINTLGIAEFGRRQVCKAQEITVYYLPHAETARTDLYFRYKTVTTCVYY